MKIRMIILGMAASLLLPLAGAFARVSTDTTMESLSGSGFYLPGETTDEGAMRRRRGSSDKGSKGSKDCKSKRRGRCHGSRGSRGSKESKSHS